MESKNFNNALVNQGMMETLTTISASEHYNAWIYDQFKDQLAGCVLDIGSGIGDIVKYYTQNSNVKKVIATDCSDDMVLRLKKTLPGRSLLRSF